MTIENNTQKDADLKVSQLIETVEKDEIEKSLDASSENELSETYSVDSIKLDKGQFSLFELKRKYEKNQIILDTSFQRDEVWGRRQKIELIESLLMGLPLPVFYFNQDTDGKIIVIDGRQRLTAIFSYMNNEFSLSKLKVLGEPFEKKFNDLRQVFQSKIEDYQISSYIVLPATPPRVKYDIFDRVNRGGTSLNKQEIRNALFQGKSTCLLNDIAESNLFEKATGGGLKNDKRMKDRYILLRFISFYMLRKSKLLTKDGFYNYSDVDDLLETTMKTINKMDDNALEDIRNLVNSTLNKCYDFFDGDVFRLKGGQKKTSINMNVFETIMYIVSLLNENCSAQAIVDKISLLKDDKIFLDSIGNHRDSLQKVEARFSMAEKIAEELMK